MHRFISLIFTLFLMILSPDETAAVTMCQNQRSISVNSGDTETIKRICCASGQALTFLSRFGLVPKRQIHIEIVEQAINNQGYLAFGKYDSRLDKIEIMSYRSILNGYDNPLMYGEFFDLEHYNGAVAHEIAHAVFHHHTLNPSPGTAPQEYLAHAVQLAVLPETKRKDIMAKMDVSAWVSGDAISDIYMALEPGKFAVKSYKHLTTASNPQEFIQILLKSNWFYVYIP